MAQFVHDLRYAARLLLRSPGFTSVALLTLALGIGANAAIFSIVNGVVLKPLGYPKPEGLMYLTTQFPAMGFTQFWVSPPEYLEFRELNQSFAAVGAFTTGEVNLMAGDRPMRVRSASVDDHLLNALAMPPAHGRLFARGETDISGPVVPGAPTPFPLVVILSHELWQNAFAGGPIVGETIDISGRRAEVIGIMPPGADVMDNRTEIWLPLGLNPANRQNRGNHYLYLVGRLKEGVSREAAATELTGLIQNWADRVGVKNHVFAPLSATGGHILQMKPLHEEVLGTAAQSIWILQAAVGLVLLIACANLASLLLARAETRRREFAIRTAMGATTQRLLRQFVAEGLLLSIAGGLAGVVLAAIGVPLLLRAYPTTLPRSAEIGIDPAVVLFTFGVALATGLMFGLAPILHTRANRLMAALKQSGSRGTMGSARHRVHHGLVVAEVALAALLAVGAGLLARSVSNLTNVDAGFERSHLITFSMTLPAVNYPEPAARSQLLNSLLDRLRAIPWVQGATAMSGLPPNRPVNANDTDIDNYTAPAQGPYENVDYYQAVAADYFETMGIPIVQGRSFQTTDAASTGLVAIVNETLVNTFWSGQNPVGQRLRPCCGENRPWFTVVGVARDVKQGGVDQKTGTEFYYFIDQTAVATPPGVSAAPATMNVVLRSSLAAEQLSQPIADAVQSADRSVPVVRLRGMDGVFTETIRRPRLLAQLVGAFAALALLLAAIGTYGVLSYVVADRRREIGIRMALGASRADVLGRTMRQGMQLTVAGVVAGAIAAIALNRVMQSVLFGVQPNDPRTYTIAFATIGLIAAVACGLPAWRASRLDPNVALREE